MKQKYLHLFTVKKIVSTLLLVAAFVLPLHVQNKSFSIQVAEAADPAKVEECKKYYAGYMRGAGTEATQLSGAISTNSGQPNESWTFSFSGEKTNINWTTDDLSYYGTLVRDSIARKYPARASEVQGQSASTVQKVFNSLPAADRESINNSVQPLVKTYHQEVYNATFNRYVTNCENTEIKVDQTTGQVTDLTSEEGNQAIQEAEAAANAAKREGDEIYCLDTDKSPMLSWAGCTAQVAYVFLYFASWVLWVAAIFFNYTIDYTLNIAGFLNKTQIVEIGWVTFRDFANLFFIFIILYIAISTIIGNAGFKVKDLLGKVIVAAILINFSLFFTKAIIDVSNVFALQFYSKITQSANSKAGSLDGGISAALASAMGMHTVMGIGSATKDSTGAEVLTTDVQLGLNPNNLIIVGFGGGIFVIITAIVFFAGALMLLARTFSLVFLMILSPFAFLGEILPSTKKYAAEWWDKLFKNAMFAPAYMALLYLVLSIVLNGNISSGSFFDIFAGKTGFVESLVTFVILNGLMVGCLVVAQKVGAAGSGFAIGTAKTVMAGGFLGGAAMVGRNTIGRAANWYSNTDAAQKATSSIGRTFTRLSNKVANSSFEARQVGGLGKKLGIGTGTDKGVKALIKDRNEARKNAVVAEGEMFDATGKAELAKRRQGGWFKGTREGGDALAKKTLEEEAAKQREILNDLREDPDYKDFTRLVDKSQGKDGLTPEELQKVKDLHAKIGTKYNNGKVDKVKSFDSSSGKWIDAPSSEFIGALGFGGANGNKVRVAHDLAKKLAVSLNEHNRHIRIKGYEVKK